MYRDWINSHDVVFWKNESHSRGKYLWLKALSTVSIFAIFLKSVLVTSLAPTFIIVWNQIPFDFEENTWKLVLIFWAQVYLLEGKINMFYTFIADCFDCLNFVWRLTIPLNHFHISLSFLSFICFIILYLFSLCTFKFVMNRN